MDGRREGPSLCGMRVLFFEGRTRSSCRSSSRFTAHGSGERERCWPAHYCPRTHDCACFRRRCGQLHARRRDGFGPVQPRACSFPLPGARRLDSRPRGLATGRPLGPGWPPRTHRQSASVARTTHASGGRGPGWIGRDRRRQPDVRWCPEWKGAALRLVTWPMNARGKWSVASS
jgi:hypothetical protein